VDEFLSVATACADAAEVIVLDADWLRSFGHHVQIPQFLLLFILTNLKFDVCVLLGAGDPGRFQQSNFFQVAFVLLVFGVINVVNVVNKLV
jgi:hypothetical protein